VVGLSGVLVSREREESLMDRNSWICEDCDTIFDWDAALCATDPFDSDSIVYGCPECKNTFGALCTSICDEPKCKKRVCCGTPTSTGYRKTCSDHKPAYS
jgi:hypothetical protein